MKTYRLQSLLVVIAVISIPLAFGGNWFIQLSRRAAQVEQIVSRGGEVYFGESKRPWLANTLGSKRVDPVIGIHLENCGAIESEDFETVAGFPELVELSLAGTDFEVGDAQNLGQLSKLRSLHINQTPADDQLMQLVCAGAPNLVLVDVSATRCTDLTLHALATQGNVIELHIADTQVTDLGMEEVANMPALRLLDLEGTLITDAGVATLARTRIETLHIGSYGMTGKSLTSLAQMPKLERLWLASPSITAEDITKAGVAPTLKELHILLPKVLPEEIGRLESRLGPKVYLVDHMPR